MLRPHQFWPKSRRKADGLDPFHHLQKRRPGPPQRRAQKGGVEAENPLETIEIAKTFIKKWSRIMQLIHIDTCGTFQVSSTNDSECIYRTVFWPKRPAVGYAMSSDLDGWVMVESFAVSAITFWGTQMEVSINGAPKKWMVYSIL